MHVHQNPVEGHICQLQVGNRQKNFTIDQRYTCIAYLFCTIYNLRLSVGYLEPLLLLLHIKFDEKPVSLINKLQPLSFQIHVQCNSTPSTSHFSIIPLNFTTLLHCSHIPNTHKKLHTRVVHRRPNVRSHSVFSCCFIGTEESNRPINNYRVIAFLSIIPCINILFLFMIYAIFVFCFISSLRDHEKFKLKRRKCLEWSFNIQMNNAS